jgi:hypothetical protein
VHRLLGKIKITDPIDFTHDLQPQSQWPNALLGHADEALLSPSQPSFRRNPVGIV